MNTNLAAFTDPDSPADGYVGSTNFSLTDDGKGIWVTVRPRGVPGSCTQAHLVPMAEALKLLGKAFFELSAVRRAQVEGISVEAIKAKEGFDVDLLLGEMLTDLEDPDA